MTGLHNLPQACNIVKGLINLVITITKRALIKDGKFSFQACPISPVPPVTLTIRFTYILDEWTDYAWPQEPPDPSSCLECKVGVKNLGTLPFGACQDPLRYRNIQVSVSSV